MPVEIVNREEELHWLALRLVPGLGTRSAGKLIAQFRTPQAVFRASRTELEGAGLSGALAQSIASGCTFEDAVAQQQKMVETGAAAIAITNPHYPPLLREIFDPPVLLFARGEAALLQSTMLTLWVHGDPLLTGLRRPSACRVTSRAPGSPS